MNNNRLEWIDFLKGLAIMGVILVHYNGAISAPSHIISSFASIGARCPQLFFIISAYLTWASISKQCSLDSKNFLKKRLVKIAPLYFIALLLIALIPTVRLFSWGDILSHVLFINGFFPEYTNSIMKVEWYIADIAIFYMIVPLLYRYIKSFKSTIIAFASSVLLNVVFTIITNYVFKESMATSGVYEMYFHTFCFVNQLPVLLIGVMVYYAKEYLELNPDKRRSLYMIPIVITVFVVVLFGVLHLNKTVLTSSLIAGMIFGLLTLLCADYHVIKKGGAISVIGKGSFGMYCLHMLIVNILSDCEPIAFFSNHLLGWFVLYLAVLVSSFFIGNVLEKLVAKLIVK